MSVEKAQALRDAAKSGNLAQVETLLKDAAGFDINFQDKYGYTALHMAAMFGHTPIVQALLRAGASRAVKTKDGETAQDVAKGMVLANVIKNFKP
jgi:ankyrin repeat protein